MYKIPDGSGVGHRHGLSNGNGSGNGQIYWSGNGFLFGSSFDNNGRGYGPDHEVYGGRGSFDAKEVEEIYPYAVIFVL